MIMKLYHMREYGLSDSNNITRVTLRKTLKAQKLFENHDAFEVCCNYSLLLKQQNLKLQCVYVDDKGSEEIACDFTSEKFIENDC